VPIAVGAVMYTAVHRGFHAVSCGVGACSLMQVTRGLFVTTMLKNTQGRDQTSKERCARILTPGPRQAKMRLYVTGMIG
jgi:hypothetical protein